MPDTVKNPVSDVYKRWSAEVKKVVGDGNYSFERSQTLAANKKMYAQMFIMGNPGTRWDIEGDEVATIPSFQIDCFATGTKSVEKVYQIDDASHRAMVSMGFQRTYGPEQQDNTDNSIKRVVSRYSRIYTGNLLE